MNYNNKFRMLCKYCIYQKASQRFLGQKISTNFKHFPTVVFKYVHFFKRHGLKVTAWIQFSRNSEVEQFNLANMALLGFMRQMS